MTTTRTTHATRTTADGAITPTTIDAITGSLGRAAGRGHQAPALTRSPSQKGAFARRREGGSGRSPDGGVRRADGSLLLTDVGTWRWRDRWVGAAAQRRRCPLRSG